MEETKRIKYNTVKPHFKAIRGFGCAYKRVGGGVLYPWWAYKRDKKNVSERRDKTYLRNELKLTYHCILRCIYNTFIVRHNKQRIYFKHL